MASENNNLDPDNFTVLPTFRWVYFMLLCYIRNKKELYRHIYLNLGIYMAEY